MQFDAFVCHASEDKEAVAEPLASLLSALGYQIWYDKFTLKLGDSLRRSIDSGLGSSNYGIVILSPSFFKKQWTQYELDALIGAELSNGGKVILPIWHNVSHQEVSKFSPSLAMKVAVKSEYGLEEIVRKVIDILGPPKKSCKQKLDSGLHRMGFAGPGSQVFMSRNMKMIFVFRDGAASDVLDAYQDHPLYKMNPALLPMSGKKEMNEPLTHVVDLPPDRDWYYVFYRMDFPPLERCPFTAENLAAVDAGEYYCVSLTRQGVDMFQLQGVMNPYMAVMFTLRGQDGRLSVVVAVGPGPAPTDGVSPDGE